MDCISLSSDGSRSQTLSAISVKPNLGNGRMIDAPEDCAIKRIVSVVIVVFEG